MGLSALARRHAENGVAPAGGQATRPWNETWAQAALATERMPWASSLTSEVTAETVFSVALPSPSSESRMRSTRAEPTTTPSARLAMVAVDARAGALGNLVLGEQLGKAQVGQVIVLGLGNQRDKITADGAQTQATVLGAGLFKLTHGSPPGQPDGQHGRKPQDPAV